MFLQQHLRRDFPEKVRQHGFAIYKSREVTRLTGNQWKVSAKVRGSRLYSVGLFRHSDEIEALCDCPYFASEGFCQHLWATVLAADEKCYLLGAFGSGPPRLMEADLGDVEDGEDGFDGEDDEDEMDFRPPGPISHPYWRKPSAPTVPTWKQLLSPLKHAESIAHTARQERVVVREIYYIVDVAPSLYGDGLHLK